MFIREEIRNRWNNVKTWKKKSLLSYLKRYQWKLNTKIKKTNLVKE